MRQDLAGMKMDDLFDFAIDMNEETFLEDLADNGVRVVMEEFSLG